MQEADLRQHHRHSYIGCSAFSASRPLFAFVRTWRLIVGFGDYRHNGRSAWA